MYRPCFAPSGYTFQMFLRGLFAGKKEAAPGDRFDGFGFRVA